LRSAQRRRENEVGRRLGYTAQHMSDLRSSYFKLDAEGSGGLSIADCRRALLMMKKKTTLK